MAEPPFRLADAPDPVLEQALADLGRNLVFPPTPNIAGRVADALRAEATPPVAPSVGPDFRSLQPASRDTGDAGVAPTFGVHEGAPDAAVRPPGRMVFQWRRGWLAAAAILLLLVAGLLIFPGIRTTIADRLGLPGVEIRWFENEPTPVPAPDVSSLGLGRSVTLDEAREAAPFPIAVPSLPGFADPHQVYLRGAGDRAMVSFVYPASADLPSGEVSGVGALLTQFPGSTNRGFIMKGLSGFADGATTSIESITVGGNPGFWIADAPHGVLLVCNQKEEECREERYRLAGNVLLWGDDGTTLRIESALSREEALAIAESMQIAFEP